MTEMRRAGSRFGLLGGGHACQRSHREKVSNSLLFQLQEELLYFFQSKTFFAGFLWIL